MGERSDDESQPCLFHNLGKRITRILELVRLCRRKPPKHIRDIAKNDAH